MAHGGSAVISLPCLTEITGDRPFCYLLVPSRLGLAMSFVLVVMELG